MRGQQYSDQQEPPPLRLSSTSYIVLRLHLHRHDDLRCTTDTLYAKYTLMRQPSQLILPSSVSWFVVLSSSPYSSSSYEAAENEGGQSTKQKICIIGAGWGGLSAAHALVTSNQSSKLDITLVDATPCWRSC